MSLIPDLVLVIVAVGAVLTVRQPFIGLLMYLWLDFMRPHDSFVELRAFRPMLIIGVTTVAATAWYQRHRLLHVWRSLLPVLALLGAVSLSTLTNSGSPPSIEAPLLLSKMVLLVWLLATLVTTRARFEAVLWVICLSLLVSAVGAILQGLDRGLMHEFRVELVVGGPPGSHDGLFRDNNDFARVLAMTVPLWWLLGVRADRAWRMALAIAGLLLTVVAIEFTFSRTGLLALVVGVSGIALAYRPWWRAVLIPTLLVAAMLTLSPRPYVERIATITRPTSEPSVVERVGIWRQAAEVVRKHPLVGQGPNSFRLGRAKRTSHNIFIEVVGETGLIGLAAYGWLLLWALVALHRLRREPERGGPSPPRAQSLALQAALLAFLTAGLALGAPFQSSLFVLVGLTSALREQPGHVTTTDSAAISRPMAG